MSGAGPLVANWPELLDEYEFECDEKIAQEVATMIEKAIERAGQFLKLSVELKGEGKVGKSWREVH